jgi:hypothetical protein
MITATVAVRVHQSRVAAFTVRLGAILILYLEVNTGTLAIGEMMSITTTARNIGDDRLTLTGPSDCLLFLRISNSLGTVVYESNCSGPTVTEELSAGQEKVQVFSWGGTSSAGSRLPSGFYQIQAVARVTGNASAGPPLFITVE